MSALDVEPGPWVFFMLNGRPMKRRPFCDCTKVGFGFTQRDDGVWVRPCCMRRERAAYDRLGDGPVQHNPLTCDFCKERVAREAKGR